MDNKNIETLLYASEKADSIELLSKLAKAAIENDIIEKPWDLYLLLGVIEKLSKDISDKLWQIQDELSF